MKERYRNLAIFYIVAYLTDYLFGYTEIVLSLSFAWEIAGTFALAAILFLLVYTLSKSGGYWSPYLVGFRRTGVLSAFVWANAFILPERSRFSSDCMLMASINSQAILLSNSQLASTLVSALRCKLLDCRGNHCISVA